ncbi:Fic family protein [Sedimentitalea nanhaiensis]|nr:Fic family protein [Sedimentitalea nanhaiensis]
MAPGSSGSISGAFQRSRRWWWRGQPFSEFGTCGNVVPVLFSWWHHETNLQYHAESHSILLQCQCACTKKGKEKNILTPFVQKIYGEVTKPMGLPVVMTETNDSPRKLFRSRTLPVPAYLAGYSHLIDALGLNTILPSQLHAVAGNNTRQRSSDWIIHPHPKRPRRSHYDHMVFALKYEGVNLLILKQVFQKIGAGELQSAINAQPTSGYARRLCFLFEWLTQQELIAPDSLGGAYVDAVDPKHQYAASRPDNISRWRVRDNLPGTPGFCPLVTRTKKLDRYFELDLSAEAEQTIRDVPKELLRRAAAFLLLNDSKASFEIEKERPSKDRAQRWATVIGRAGESRLSVAVLVEMQRALIEDDRFVKLGLREEGGFVGEHTPFGEPRPDHISAKAQDLDSLVAALVAYEASSEIREYDAVLTAAALAFGFVYVHPFEDGNGRLHRYLIHHVLATRKFFPEDVIPPISVAILADLVAYRHVLESVSQPMLSVVNWQPTQRGNVEVLNETIDYYRYFDSTPHAEFLFDCLKRTIEKELRDELRFLSSRDDFHRGAREIIDMPERILDLLFHMLRQNDGHFSKRMRAREFDLLRDSEAAEFEKLYRETTSSL